MRLNGTQLDLKLFGKLACQGERGDKCAWICWSLKCGLQPFRKYTFQISLGSEIHSPNATFSSDCYQTQVWSVPCPCKSLIQSVLVVRLDWCALACEDWHTSLTVICNLSSPRFTESCQSKPVAVEVWH